MPCRGHFFLLPLLEQQIQNALLAVVFFRLCYLSCCSYDNSVCMKLICMLLMLTFTCGMFSIISGMVSGLQSKKDFSRAKEIAHEA